MSTSSDEFGPVHAEFGGEGIEAFDEIVVELDEYFTASHCHMVMHVVVEMLR